MQKKTTYSEAELISLLKTKDERAYNHLYDNYSGALYHVIVKVLGNREEVVDVLQESYIKIWKNIGQYDPVKGRLFTWMLQVTRNTAIDFMRSGSTQKENKTKRLETDFHINDQKNVTYMPTDHLGLSKVVDGLRAEDRQIVDLAYFQGFTQHEIAEKLSIPLGTVKTRARMALSKLRNILKTN